MITTFKLNTSELNIEFIESIKKIFFNKEIEILIKTVEQDLDFKYSDKLINAIENVENNKNLKTFTINEFEKYSKSLVQ